MKREKVNYTIQSVSHALDILESFTKTEDELGVTELSKRLGLHKNNVFRLLATLEHRGYIEQNKATENYRLGPKTLQIGSIFIEQRECRRQARPDPRKPYGCIGRDGGRGRPAREQGDLHGQRGDEQDRASHLAHRRHASRPLHRRGQGAACHVSLSRSNGCIRRSTCRRSPKRASRRVMP